MVIFGSEADGGGGSLLLMFWEGLVDSGWLLWLVLVVGERLMTMGGDPLRR